MRTSLTEIKLIDDHLFNLAEPADSVLFDAMLLIDERLAEQVKWQKRTHTYIRDHGRKKLKTEIEAVHQQLFNHPEHQSFKQLVMSLFRK